MSFMHKLILKRKEEINMSQLIPKIIHQIWIGNSDIPSSCQQYIDSWKTHHPDWEYRLWTDDNMIKLQNQELYDSTTSVRQKADIARYELLYQFGGVYVDIDMECFKNIEPLLDEVEFFVGTEDDFYFSNELMGCMPHHELMCELIEGIPSSMHSAYNLTIDEQSGPIYITKYLLWMPQVTVVDQEIFFPKSTLKKSYAAHRAKILASL